EVQRDQLLRGHPAVLQQVTSGDADVEPAGADIDGDVTRAQEEELDVVLVVGHDELGAVAPDVVARVAEQLAGGGGQRALVRYRETQHVHSESSGPQAGQVIWAGREQEPGLTAVSAQYHRCHSVGCVSGRLERMRRSVHVAGYPRQPGAGDTRVRGQRWR